MVIVMFHICGGHFSNNLVFANIVCKFNISYLVFVWQDIQLYSFLGELVMQLWLFLATISNISISPMVPEWHDLILNK